MTALDVITAIAIILGFFAAIAGTVIVSANILNDWMQR